MMKTIALMLMLAVCSVNLGGCFVGKGKAPAPIVTRG
jgi:predicted small secreted protein